MNLFPYDRDHQHIALQSPHLPLDRVQTRLVKGISAGLPMHIDAGARQYGAVIERLPGVGEAFRRQVGAQDAVHVFPGDGFGAHDAQLGAGIDGLEDMPDHDGITDLAMRLLAEQGDPLPVAGLAFVSPLGIAVGDGCGGIGFHG